jgi:hypothetical protein
MATWDLPLAANSTAPADRQHTRSTRPCSTNASGPLPRIRRESVLLGTYVQRCRCVSVVELQWCIKTLVIVCRSKLEPKTYGMSKNFPDNPHNLKYIYIYFSVKQTVSTVMF